MKAIIMNDSDVESPRGEGNIGTLCLFHRRYTVPNESGKSPDELHRFTDPQRGFKGVCLPVFMYDHSGLALNTTGFACQWDSGQLGIIYAEQSRIEKEFPEMEEKTAIQHAHDILRIEVAVFGAWLNGECYGYRLVDDEGGTLDTCFGFIGTESVESAARDAARECGADAEALEIEYR